ncbi:27186_t:CDS:1, partial [Racocetra persica]
FEPNVESVSNCELTKLKYPESYYLHRKGTNKDKKKVSKWNMNPAERRNPCV